MDESALKRLIQNLILLELARRGSRYIPAAVSARHIHLCRKDLEALFGPGAVLTPLRELSQPGQFASNQTLEIAGPKGTLTKVRVLGPERDSTQVEVSISDSFTLGIKPVIRMSGSIDGTPGCTLIGPAGRVELARGLIVAARHIHMSDEQAAAYGLKNGDSVSLKVPPPREGIIGGIVVRAGAGYDLELHLDTDEANGSSIGAGDILELWSPGNNSRSASPGVSLGTKNNVPPGEQKTPLDPPGSGLKSCVLDLVTERDVNTAFTKGEVLILCTAGGLISPLALDRAKEKGITIRQIGEKR
jgi:putative phosphotransacetylase